MIATCRFYHLAVRVVRGREVVDVAASELADVLRGYSGLTIDVGTGDGRFAYVHARRNPQRFVVGLDPSRERLRETSSRALRKPSRGGVPNVMFVWASAEQPPAELEGLADEVYVILPWGKLLRGVVRGEPEVLAGLRALSAPHAALRVVLGADVWSEPVPVEVRDLPELTLEYLGTVLTTAFAAHGLRVARVYELPRDEIERLRSSWARRLSHGREQPRFLAVDAVAVAEDRPNVTTPRGGDRRPGGGTG